MTSNSPSGQKTYFEEQRAHLISEIGLAMEHVLMNLNTLNRNMEAVVAVGKEFESVESLWSKFEGVMGKEVEKDAKEGDPPEGEGSK
ncbi:DASH complex subunit Dad1-domain-containing protein [Geopyxis carbonaria]|nr:DASH complex subunit Dad1-domain-containing protein [Geopyxis carbonaria]